MSLSRAEFEALYRKLQGPVRRAFEKAVQKARSRAQINALVRAVEAGDIEAILLAAGVREGMWSIFTEQVRTAYSDAGFLIMASDLTGGGGGGGPSIDLDFDINNPRAEQWLRINSSSMIRGDGVTGGLMPQQRAAVQEILQSGMAKGANPRTTALDIVGRIGKTGRRQGGVLGLTGPQAKAAVNMASDLENLDRRYFTRTLRDRRFDGIVRKSMDIGNPLPQKTRNKIIGRYEDRLLKHRGDTIARTEVLSSVNAASDEALHQIVDEGLAPRHAAIRIWRHSFSAKERPGHLRMEDQRRGLDELFVNPITGIALPYPGSGPASEIINCRCFIEHEINFFAVERAA